MTLIADRFIDANSVSEGWLDAVRLLHTTPKRKAVHLVVRIRKPVLEIAAVRAEADSLIEVHPETWPVDTTRNTIFPAAWAHRHPEPADLARYYRERYPALRKIDQNNRGTYFGRIVNYPRQDGTYGDQLTETVRKLRQELATPGPKSSRFEINIYSEGKDTNPMSFPCMAHISVHLHEGAVHMQAVYRNELLLARAYGNFLGLGQLQSYIAKAVQADLGELLMTINHAELDGKILPVKAALDRLSAL